MTCCNNASHKSLRWREQEGAGHKCRVGQAMTSKSVCVFFFTYFVRIRLICLGVMRLFITGHSHCHTPFCQLTWTVNQLSFGSWPTFQLKFVQICESIWKLCTFLRSAIPIATPLLANWHECKHTHTHTNLISVPNFSLLGRKLWPPKSGEFFWTNQWQSNRATCRAANHN